MRVINRLRAPAAFAESRIPPAGAKGAAIANAGKGNRLARYWFATACSALACLVAPTAASANTSIGCWGLDRNGKRFVETSVKDFAKLDYVGLMLVINSWKEHARSLGYDLVECNVHDNRQKTVASLIQRRDWNRENSQSTTRWMDDFEAPKPRPEPGKVYFGGSSSNPPKARAAPAPAPSRYVEVAGPNGPIRLSPEVAARNQAAADDYRRKMDQHAQSIAEHDQRLAQHRQNAATAASAEDQHKREVAAAGERYAAYRVAMADHARKVAGASTNDDPNTCITRPEFRSNDGFPGNTSASVINGCAQKVDIVLCLKRSAGDWTCGAKFGILTQGKMSYATRNATGEIFVDAITYGGGGKLKRPAGM